MQVLKSPINVRSLTHIAATASAARVLDLHSLSVEDPGDAEYLERPLFMHPVLNRSIIVKHTARPDESEWCPPGRLSRTKVIFPFDQFDLNLGGQALVVDEDDFIDALTRHLDYTDLPLGRDVLVLQALDRLPTLDPFLVSESLNRKRIAVGRCYFRFSNADRTAMLEFVSGEIEALIKSCFGELKGNTERTQRLSRLLLADQSSPGLAPLRHAFGMSETEFAEAIFAWKAFLYYRWRSRELGPMLTATLRSMATISAKAYQRDELAFVIKAKPLLGKTIIKTWREVEQRLGRYDKAFASLTARENSDGFRLFLLNGSNLFVDLGDRIGRLEQTVSFWRHRFGPARNVGLAPEAAIDGLRDLMQALSIPMGGPSSWESASERRAKLRARTQRGGR